MSITLSKEIQLETESNYPFEHQEYQVILECVYSQGNKGVYVFGYDNYDNALKSFSNNVKERGEFLALIGKGSVLITLSRKSVIKSQIQLSAI